MRIAFLALLIALSACKGKSGAGSSGQASNAGQKVTAAGQSCSSGLSKSDIAGLGFTAVPVKADQLVVQRFDAESLKNRVLTIKVKVDSDRLPEGARGLQDVFAQVKVCEQTANKQSPLTKCQGPDWAHPGWSPKSAELSDKSADEKYDWEEDKMVVRDDIPDTAIVSVRVCSNTSSVCGAWKEFGHPTQLREFTDPSTKELMSALTGNLAARKMLVQWLAHPAKNFLRALYSMRPYPVMEGKDLALESLAKNVTNANAQMRGVFGADKDEAAVDALTEEGKNQGAGLAGGTTCLGLTDDGSTAPAPAQSTITFEPIIDWNFDVTSQKIAQVLVVGHQGCAYRSGDTEVKVAPEACLNYTDLVNIAQAPSAGPGEEPTYRIGISPDQRSYLESVLGQQLSFEYWDQKLALYLAQYPARRYEKFDGNQPSHLRFWSKCLAATSVSSLFGDCEQSTGFNLEQIVLNSSYVENVSGETWTRSTHQYLGVRARSLSTPDTPDSCLALVGDTLKLDLCKIDPDTSKAGPQEIAILAVDYINPPTIESDDTPVPLPTGGGVDIGTNTGTSTGSTVSVAWRDLTAPPGSDGFRVLTVGKAGCAFLAVRPEDQTGNSIHVSPLACLSYNTIASLKGHPAIDTDLQSVNAELEKIFGSSKAPTIDSQTYTDSSEMVDTRPATYPGYDNSPETFGQTVAYLYNHPGRRLWKATAGVSVDEPPPSTGGSSTGGSPTKPLPIGPYGTDPTKKRFDRSTSSAPTFRLTSKDGATCFTLKLIGRTACAPGRNASDLNLQTMLQGSPNYVKDGFRVYQRNPDLLGGTSIVAGGNFLLAQRVIEGDGRTDSVLTLHSLDEAGEAEVANLASDNDDRNVYPPGAAATAGSGGLSTFAKVGIALGALGVAIVGVSLAASFRSINRIRGLTGEKLKFKGGRFGTGVAIAAALGGIALLVGFMPDLIKAFSLTADPRLAEAEARFQKAIDYAEAQLKILKASGNALGAKLSQAAPQ